MKEISTHVGYEFEIEENIEKLIVKSKHLTGHEGSPYPYHDTKDYTAEGRWRVESDDSLRRGAEFITPVKKMEDSFKTMREFFEIVKTTNSITTIRCGCHTNICLMDNGMVVKQDEGAIIENINWSLLHALWNNRIGNRIPNMYCNHMRNIITKIKQRHMLPPTLKHDTILKSSNKLSRALLSSFHGFIVRKQSLITERGCYYELRFLGGIDYHLYPEKIETTVKHFSDVLRKAIYCPKNKSLKQNRKMISYINRITALTLPTNELSTFEHADLLENIRNIAKMYSNPKLNTPPVRYLNDISSTVYRISDTLAYYNKDESRQNAFSKYVTAKMYEYNIIYYILKYYVINGFEKVLVAKPMVPLRGIGIDLTIPDDEYDVDKLWTMRIFYTHLNTKEQKIILDSMKNKKTKKYFLKQLLKRKIILEEDKKEEEDRTQKKKYNNKKLKKNVDNLTKIIHTS